MLSDAEKARRIAGAHIFPGVPSQTGQVHGWRDAARPLGDADHACKKALNQAMRGPFDATYRERER